MNKPLGFISLFVSSILFGSYGFFVRELSSVLTPSQQVYYRYTLGFLLISAVILIRDKRIQISKYLTLKALLFGLTIPISFLLFVLTLLHAKLSVGLSGYFVGLSLMSIIINKFYCKETLDAFGKWALVLNIAGLLFLAGSNTTQYINLGLVFGLLSGALYAIGNLFKKQLKELSRMDILLIMSFFNTVILFVYSSFVGESPTPISLYMTCIVVLFLFIALAAEYLTVVGFRNFDLYFGSIILSFELVMTTVLGYFMYKESLTAPEIIGGLLVLLAIFISNGKELILTRFKSVA